MTVLSHCSNSKSSSRPSIYMIFPAPKWSFARISFEVGSSKHGTLRFPLDNLVYANHDTHSHQHTHIPGCLGLYAYCLPGSSPAHLHLGTPWTGGYPAQTLSAGLTPACAICTHSWCSMFSKSCLRSMLHSSSNVAQYVHILYNFPPLVESWCLRVLNNS